MTTLNHNLFNWRNLIIGLFIISAFALMCSCTTQRKATNWFDDHPVIAAGYCSLKYPPDTVTRKEFKNVDSSGYEEAYNNMSHYADSLFYRLDSLQHARQAAGLPCPSLNLDSLRKEVDKEIRRRLKPCVDSVTHIFHTVVDMAKVKELEGKLGQKDATITERDKTITELQKKVKDKNKWIWMFWGLLLLLGLYAVLKLKRIISF